MPIKTKVFRPALIVLKSVLARAGKTSLSYAEMFGTQSQTLVRWYLIKRTTHHFPTDFKMDCPEKHCDGRRNAILHEKTDWWKGAVIYQVYPRSFFDSNADGIGDLPGVTAKLDHIASLGVDAIWLAPFFTSPQKDFGYDVSDYRGVDSSFGTLADFDKLIVTAHRLGLKVLIDQVWSHTSDQHPWFLQSRADRSNDKANWYVWADPLPDGTPPNNWLAVFGGSAWKWEPRRRQYYLHHFLSEQPALNFHNIAVIDAVLDAGRFWLERSVDGFRLDAIDWLLHDPKLRSNPAMKNVGNVPAKLFGMQEHKYDLLHPDTENVLARIRNLMDEYPGTATLGEVSSQPGAFLRVKGYTSGQDHLHMAYTLRWLRCGFDWTSVGEILQDVASFNDHGWPCLSFSNHDAERAISRWNPDPSTRSPDPRFARLLFTLLLTMRGSVCIYQGEELGLTEATLSFKQMQDPFGIAHFPAFRGRDGSRTPIPWEPHLPHAGFTQGNAPWLPVPGDHHALAVAAQEDDPEALLHACREIIALRKAHPELMHGDFTIIALPFPCVGFRRKLGGHCAYCLFNLSDKDALIEPTMIDGLEGQYVLEPFGTRVIFCNSVV